jgi:2'-5' RNA ligase
LKRLFIGIKIEPLSPLKNFYKSVKSNFENERIKWVDMDNIHITLAFLGDTAEDRVRSLDRMLKSVCPGFGKFSFLLSGLGIFKDLSNPGILWIGVKQYEELKGLNNLISDGLRKEGFNIERRTFKPHVTVGRIKYLNDKSVLRSVLELYRDADILEVNVEKITLFESTLLPSGPVYTPLGLFPLM